MIDIVSAHDVNDALNWLVRHSGWRSWRRVAPRGKVTWEHPGPLVTEYLNPTQRVLFSEARDANPFFHFFEALWILNGDDDVAFLRFFNSNIAQFSDDGVRFHAPYGYRLRKAFGRDQLRHAVQLLRADNDTRQVVLQIWDAGMDLGTPTKDMPCNDTVFLKVRDGRLDMSVMCRSNDAIWGAYGANAVQFSTLQEWIAGAVGVSIGTYWQYSDSFHIYEDNDAWKRLCAAPPWPSRPYGALQITPFPLWTGWDHSGAAWLAELERFISYARIEMVSVASPTTLYLEVPYLRDVATPLFKAWRHWRNVGMLHVERGARIDAALEELEHCEASDWRVAAQQWLERRRELQAA